MSIDTREARAYWATRTDNNNYHHPLEYQRASLAVLLDIRDELQRLNSLLHCSNFIGIPRTLAAINSNTTKVKRKAAKRV